MNGLKPIERPLTVLVNTSRFSVQFLPYLFRPLCVQLDQWVTQGGSDPLPLEEEHCSAVEVTEEDIQNSVKFVPSLSAVVSILGIRC